jgi:hypothetical protein
MTPEPQANASRRLRLPATQCTERVAPPSHLMYVRGRGSEERAFFCKTSADPWVRGSRDWPTGAVASAASVTWLCRTTLLLTGKRRCRIGSASDYRTAIT